MRVKEIEKKRNLVNIKSVGTECIQIVAVSFDMESLIMFEQ